MLLSLPVFAWEHGTLPLVIELTRNSKDCMHGQTECLGNMLSLCANNLFPTNPKISLGFSTCMIMSYQRIPSRDLVQSCALEHGVPFDDLNACVSEEGKGLDLLEASIKRSEDAGVKKSCTVSESFGANRS